MSICPRCHQIREGDWKLVVARGEVIHFWKDGRTELCKINPLRAPQSEIDEKIADKAANGDFN